jgi:hypothetical protein
MINKPYFKYEIRYTVGHCQTVTHNIIYADSVNGQSIPGMLLFEVKQQHATIANHMTWNTIAMYPAATTVITKISLNKYE